MERIGLTIETTYDKGKEITTIKKAHGYYLPNKTTTIEPSGRITEEHNYANGLSVTRVKENGKFRVTKITKRGIIPALFEETRKKSSTKASGIILCEETIAEYAKLPERLKKVCRPYIQQLIENARKALK